MKLRINPGVYSDFTATDAQGHWKDSNFVRFRNRLPETMGASRELKDENDILAEFRGVCRRIHDWSNLSGTPYTSLGTSKKLYLYTGGSIHDVTPLRVSNALTDPFSTNITGIFDPTTQGDPLFVQVTDVAHGAREGDVIRVSGGAAVGGITIAGEYEVRSIVDQDNFIIRHSVVPSSTAVGGGSVTVDYDINGGLDAGENVDGYGIGDYGIGDYGIADPTPPLASGFNPGARTWSLDNWGEDLLASPVNEGLYWWDRTNGTGTRAQLVTQAPSRIQRMAISPQFRYCIAFGASPEGSTERDPLLIRWCDSNDFTLWIPAEGNTAGDIRLDVGSEIITAIRTRRSFLVWTDISLHTFSYVGPSSYWSANQVAENVKISGPNAAISAGGVSYWMGVNNFYIYDGIHRIMPCPVWNKVFKDFNVSQGDQVYASINERFSEIRWDFPSSGSTRNDRFVTYNYADNAWTVNNESRTAFQEVTPLFDLPYAVDGGYGVSDDVKGIIYLHETDPEDNLEQRNSFIESADFMLDEGGLVMYLHRIYPNFARMNGRVTFTLRVKKEMQDRQYSEYVFKNIDDLIGNISLHIRGRQASLRISSRFISDSWRMGNPVIELSQDGER